MGKTPDTLRALFISDVRRWVSSGKELSETSAIRGGQVK